MVNQLRKSQKPWGLLGDIEFELDLAPRTFDYSEASTFAEHERIEGKASLQYTGEDLQELTWTFRFGAAWCDPDEQLRRLQAARAEHQPLALVLGAGRFKADYVIERIRVVLAQTDERGQTLELQVQVTLKESVTKAQPRKKLLFNPFKKRV